MYNDLNEQLMVALKIPFEYYQRCCCCKKEIDKDDIIYGACFQCNSVEWKKFTTVKRIIDFTTLHNFSKLFELVAGNFCCKSLTFNKGAFGWTCTLHNLCGDEKIIKVGSSKEEVLIRVALAFKYQLVSRECTFNRLPKDINWEYTL